MVQALGFGRTSTARVWSEGDIALGRVGLEADGRQLGDADLHTRGPATAACDLRLPAHSDDRAAHDTVFDALDRGTFPEALDGEFAIAVWDSRRGALILARDRVGIRPLFLTRPAPGCLAFASFPEALIESGLVKGRYSRAGLARRALSSGQTSDTATWIEDIERLPPGHVLTVGPSGERLRRYWRFPVGQASNTYGDHASAARALREKFEAAVNRALPESGPIFSHLSGGLDSAAVTAMAAHLSGRAPSEVTGCCFVLPEGSPRPRVMAEELSARAVAERSGVTFLTYPMDAVGDHFLNPLAHAFVMPDYPEYPYNWFLARSGAQGADRVLCGYGGDEVVSFNGHGVALADLLALRWRTMLRTGREHREPLWRALVNQLTEAYLPAALDQRLRHLLGKPQSYRLLRERLVRSPFNARTGQARPSFDPAEIQRAGLERPGFRERLELQAWRAARQGVRYVFPLLDWRLLEFAATVPARLQIRGGLGRALFRSAVADLLPAEMLERRVKVTSGLPMTYQLALRRDELIAEARRLAASEAASAVIDLPEIERRLAALPAPEKVADAIRNEDTRFRDLAAVSTMGPFLAARALAQNEADCAARERGWHAVA